MRIAITNPTSWPYLRRGVERFINELAPYLAAHGHDVTILTAKPGRAARVTAGGFTTIYARRQWHPVLARIGWLEFHAFFLPALTRLLTRRDDVVLACTFMDGYAARLARRVTGVPYVYTALSVPPPVPNVRSLSLGGAVHARAVLGADHRVCISTYMREYMKNRWGADADVLPVPVDTRRLDAVTRRRERDVIICAAALDDPRKGGPTLMRAFDLLKRRRPAAVLRLAWTMSAGTRAALLDLVSPAHRDDVRFLGTDVDVFEEFAAASVSVLPSLWEAQGLVLLESLAVGTPVVGTRSGALPGIICDPRIGRLFEPGADNAFGADAAASLAQALDESLDLSGREETAACCRARAHAYSWDVVGPQWETLLENVAGQVSGEPAVEGLR